MKTTTDFAIQLSKFLSEYLPHERNVSPNTIYSYKEAFIQYIDFMQEIKGIGVNKITLVFFSKDNIIEFLNWLKEARKCSPATQNYRLAAFHSFVKYLQYHLIERMAEWQEILSIRFRQTERKALSYLSVEGIKLVLKQPDVNTMQGRRHLAMLALMYDTGARVQELADLIVDSVRIFNEPYTIKLFGKGRKARVVPLVTEQVILLREYMQEHSLFDNNKVDHPLFFNSRNEKLTRVGITYILKKYSEMARKESPELIPANLSCHSLRHSRAMHLLQAGVNIVYLRDILGHVSIQTTDIYARADSKAKREALEKAYTPLTPNIDKDREWERQKGLRDWLKSL